MKSSKNPKDIDIVVDYNGLASLKSNFSISKNERMRKYEIRLEKFDIDIYVSHYSRLAIPCEELLRDENIASIEGIKTIRPEALLVLKQSAEIDRRATPKGKKDSLDIMSLLLFAPIDWKRYQALLEEHGIKNYAKELEGVVSGFNDQDLSYLGIGFVKFKKWKKKMLSNLRKMR